MIVGGTSKEDRASILLVDDNPEKLLALECVLDELGQDLIKATSGAEALRRLLEGEFAVILLDINMPGMDGFETAKMIRSRKASEHTPIIFLTSFDDEFHLSKSYSVGAVDYILTPIVPEVLKTKVGVFVELFKSTGVVRRQAESLRKRAAQLHRLTAASLEINAARSIDKMLKAITDAARDILGCHQSMTVATLGLEWERAQVIRSVSERYPAWTAGRLGAVELALFAPVIDRNEVVRKPADEPHPAQAGDEDRERFPPMRGWLAAPLTDVEGRNMGLIEVADRLSGNFSEDDEMLLVHLAQMASIAIQNLLQADAREANRLKDEFLATLSHELRTPLNAILGWISLLRSGPPDAAHLERGLEVIERNARAQMKLIEDLLDVSRISKGKIRINARWLSFRPIVEAAVEALRPLAASKQVAVVSSLATAAGEIHGDADRLQQIITNLLSNAIKFTPSGGRIEVGLAHIGHSVELRISDTGEGISEEFLPHVFNRFRQADSTSRRSQGGLGIGLSIVRDLVELHGGDVRAETKGKGKGSTFIVRIPTPGEAGRLHVLQPVPRMRQGVGAAAAGDLDGATIVVVDDDPDTRELVAHALREHRADVRVAASAHEALMLLERVHAAVLVSDIAMPETDGYDLIRQIRLRPTERGGGIPAIALTAYARDEDRAQALAAGFQLHIAKPVDPNELVSAVSSLLEAVVERVPSIAPSS